MLLKCCSQYERKFGKLSSGHRIGKCQLSFQSQRRAMPRYVQITIQLRSFHMLAMWCSKPFKLGGASGKETAANAGVVRDASLIPRWGKIPWRRKWQPTSLFLPGKSYGQRILLGYSSCVCRVRHDLATEQAQAHWGLCSEGTSRISD